MRNFAIGSMAILLAVLAGTAAADERSSARQSANPAPVLTRLPSDGQGKCISDNGRTYAVGLTACIDQSINKCMQVVNPKNPNDVFIGWVDQHIKCNP